MTIYHREFRYWSVVEGCLASRLSMCDDRGGEYFVIVPVPQRGWREVRDKAIAEIEQAMDDGAEPGEVRLERA